MQVELDEIAFYMPYLPAQLSDDELSSAVKEIISKVGATSMKDMGKVMGIIKPKAQGRADMSQISSLIKQKLS